MELKAVLQHFLPKEFIEYFELKSIEETQDQLVISLDEKPELPPEHKDKALESKGFTTPVYLQDFPIRDHKVLLKVRRRKWRDRETGKTCTRDWEIKQPGTSYTKEFALFLKKMFGYQTGKR